MPLTIHSYTYSRSTSARVSITRLFGWGWGWLKRGGTLETDLNRGIDGIVYLDYASLVLALVLRALVLRSSKAGLHGSLRGTDGRLLFQPKTRDNALVRQCRSLDFFTPNSHFSFLSAMSSAGKPLRILLQEEINYKNLIK